MKKISLTDLEVMHLRDFYKSELEAAKKRIATLTSVLSKLGEISDAEEKEVNKLLGSEVKVSKKSSKKVVQETGKKRGRPPKVKATATPVETEIKTKTKVVKPKSPKPKISKPKPLVAKVVRKPKAKKERKVKNQQVKSFVDSQESSPKPKRTKRKVKSVRKPIKMGKGVDKVKWNEFVVNAVLSSNKFIHSSEITKLAAEKFGIKVDDMDRVRLVVAGALTKLVKSSKLIVHKKAGVRGGLYGLPEWKNESGELLKEIKDKL